MEKGVQAEGELVSAQGHHTLLHVSLISPDCIRELKVGSVEADSGTSWGGGKSSYSPSLPLTTFLFPARFLINRVSRGFLTCTGVFSQELGRSAVPEKVVSIGLCGATPSRVLSFTAHYARSAPELLRSWVFAVVLQLGLFGMMDGEINLWSHFCPGPFFLAVLSQPGCDSMLGPENGSFSGPTYVASSHLLWCCLGPAVFQD